MYENGRDSLALGPIKAAYNRTVSGGLRLLPKEIGKDINAILFLGGSVGSVFNELKAVCLNYGISGGTRTCSGGITVGAFGTAEPVENGLRTPVREWAGKYIGKYKIPQVLGKSPGRTAATWMGDGSSIHHGGYLGTESGYEDGR